MALWAGYARRTPEQASARSTPHGSTQQAGEEGGQRRGGDDEPMGPAARRGRGAARQLPRRLRGGEGRLRTHHRQQAPARRRPRQEGPEGHQAGGRRAQGRRQRPQGGAEEAQGAQEGRRGSDDARAARRGRRRARRERRPAHEGARRAVRQGGGVRLRLDRARHAAGRRVLTRIGAPRRRPASVPAGRRTDYDRFSMAVTTPATAAGETAPSGRQLESDKAKRIVDAMRASVAARGAAGSTFDHVAREAGVSRGLLHYYFGTKERLLVEVVRRDAEIRLAALAASLGDAQTADDFIDAMVRSLEALVGRDPGFVVLMHELFTLSRRNEEIAGELAALARAAR